MAHRAFARRAVLAGRCVSITLEQFQGKCAAVFRPELRINKKLERVGDSIKR